MSSLWMVLLALAVAVPASGQKPNLSGSWTLDVQKSFLGSDHPTTDYHLTKTIEQRGSVIRETDAAVHVSVVNIPLPDYIATSELIADGKEHATTGRSPFPGMPEPKLEVVTEWQGGTLLVKEFSIGQGPASTEVRRYFLSDGGMELIELVRDRNGFQDLSQRLVFDRKP